MKKKDRNKLLVVVDGSDRSIQTAQYLSDITSMRNCEITLFHVFNKVPERN
jgi:nucleotide-binding universal stress UspA family protein